MPPRGPAPTVRHGAQVTGLLRDDGRSVSRRATVSTGGTGQCATRDRVLVIGADGRRSTVAAARRRPDRHAGHGGRRRPAELLLGPRSHAYQWFYRPRRHRRRHPHQRRAGLRLGRACRLRRFAAPRADTDDLSTSALAEAAPGLDLSDARHATVRSARFPGAPGFVRRSSGPGLGAGRRRRLLQGPAHRARHDRRAPGRRTACPRGHLGAHTGPAATDALRDYEATRDELSAPLSG